MRMALIFNRLTTILASIIVASVAVSSYANIPGVNATDYTYDALNRLASPRLPASTLNYSYDSVDKLLMASNVVAGGLRVGGSIASAGAIAVKNGTGDALQRIDNSGAKVRLNPKTPGQEGNVTLDFGSNGRVNIRVETHPLQPGGSPVRHANVETVTVINGKKIVTNIHILE